MLGAGILAGSDSIDELTRSDDMAPLRHGAVARLLTRVRVPSTLGTFLRSFTFGHVRQFDAVASRLGINPHATPGQRAAVEQNRLTVRCERPATE